MNRSMMKWVLIAGLGLAGCGQEPAAEDEENVLDDGKYEAWNSANNPAYVDSTFVMDVTALPVEGESAKKPIPGDYWATARDSINHRWDGENSQSPAEKYGAAFAKPGFAKAVTDNFGIYGHGRKACNESSECEDQKDGSSCVKPRDATGDKAGRCIPGWWGICHGWSPFALSENAPVKAVVKNGVTFYPGDLEALGSLVYSQNLPTKFLSERCNKEGDKLGVDNNGRVRDSECRDMNPGAVHVVAANMLGLRKVGMVEDRTYDLQVWNQPVRSFKVTNAENGKLKEITKAEAISMLGLGLKYDTLLADTEIKKMEKKTGIYEVQADGPVIIKLSGTGDGDLHVKKGAEASETVYDCRPYGGSSNEECKIADAKAGDKIYYMVLGYGETSTVSVSVGSVIGNAEYTYNTAAKRFFYVELDLNYITESSPSHESHVGQLDSYTRTDHYQYILETDENARIQGGEWVAESRQSHPDFMWWPSAKPQGSLPGGLTYADVKSLLDQAQESPTTTPVAETKTLFEGEVKGGRSNYTTVGVPGGGKLTVTVTGSGNVDLYVKMGRKPTIYLFDKKSVSAGSEETVELTAPAAGATYYVRARGIASSSTVTVTATVTPAH